MKCDVYLKKFISFKLVFEIDNIEFKDKRLSKKYNMEHILSYVKIGFVFE